MQAYACWIGSRLASSSLAGKGDRSGNLPACTLCAAVTMADSSACLKISRRSMTGIVPDSMAAESTVPGPTGGSWSTSPVAVH